MRLWTLPVLLGALLCAGCLTAEEQRAADEAKCRSYGFRTKNDAFAACLQRIDIARRAELRSDRYIDDWDAPVVVYRR